MTYFVNMMSSTISIKKFNFYGHFLLAVLIFIVFTFFDIKADASASKDISHNSFDSAILMRPDTVNAFWNFFEDAMEAAADDLGITLTVINTESDPFKLVQQVEDIASLPMSERTDAVFVPFFANTGPQVLKILDEAGIDTFIVNSSISDLQRGLVGQPREKFRHWVGQIQPNDFEVGKALASYLYQTAKEKGLNDKGQVNFIALEGMQGSRPSDLRVAGLKDQLLQTKDMSLKRIAWGYWDTKPSYSATLRMLNEFPKANVIWTVNDQAAYGAIQAAEEKGLKPGKDILIGGIDWLPETFSLIKEGKMAASLGGHFMDGAWAMVMMYDYKNGSDFSQLTGLSIDTNLRVIDAKNIEKYQDKLENIKFNRIDFKALSRTSNPALEAYNFDILKLLDSQ